MDTKKLSMEELTQLADDMFANPPKYGLTEELIHQLYVDNFNAISDIIGKIPENLRDELADAAIDAYKEQQERDA